MLPDLDPDLGTLGAGAVYAIVLGFVFVESGLLLGFFLPGDTILFGAGLVSAEGGLGGRTSAGWWPALSRPPSSATRSATRPASGWAAPGWTTGSRPAGWTRGTCGGPSGSTSATAGGRW